MQSPHLEERKVLIARQPCKVWGKSSLQEGPSSSETHLADVGGIKKLLCMRDLVSGYLISSKE